MTGTTPRTDLDARYGDPDATAVPWQRTRAVLAAAELYWLSTVRPDGRPHVTPLIGVWADEALHFTTGPAERKARNLDHDPRCVLTTGCNTLREGFDVVLEGHAARVRDEDRLRRLAAAWVDKYGEDWRFDVRDEAFSHHDTLAYVFAVSPETVFGFGKGGYSQTRYRF